MMPFARAPAPIHVSMAPHPSWSRPEEYTTPGVYNVMRAGQYYEAWLRVPTHSAGSPQWYPTSQLPAPQASAQKAMFIIVKAFNKAGVSSGLVG